MMSEEKFPQSNSVDQLLINKQKNFAQSDLAIFETREQAFLLSILSNKLL